VTLEHSSHFEEHWGIQCFVGMRKHLAWYCRGSSRAAELRSRMVRLNSPEEVVQCLKSYKDALAANFEPTDEAFRVYDVEGGSAFTSHHS